MTDLDEAECVVAVADLLKGRMEELATVYCARDHKGNRKPSFSADVAAMLDRLSDIMAEFSMPAQLTIDGTPIGPNTMNRLRATSAGEG